MVLTVFDATLFCFVRFVLMALTDYESFADTGFLDDAEIFVLKYLFLTRNLCLDFAFSPKE